MLDIQNLNAWLTELGEPFARALAVFLRECSGGSVGAGVPESPGSRTQLVGELQSFDSLDASLRRRLDECIDADDAAAEAGTLERMEFTADSPAQAATKRLRRILADRDISQKELAKMLGVTPAVVSRVLKEPDRSKLGTLRRIAAVLGVELREIL